MLIITKTRKQNVYKPKKPSPLQDAPNATNKDVNVHEFIKTLMSL